MFHSSASLEALPTERKENRPHDLMGKHCADGDAPVRRRAIRVKLWNLAATGFSNNVRPRTKAKQRAPECSDSASFRVTKNPENFSRPFARKVAVWSNVADVRERGRGDLKVIKAVIFDIDGTLVDSVDLHAEAWQKAFRRFGREVPFNEVRHQIGKGGDQLLPVFFSREELERFGEELEKFRGELFKREYLPRVVAFPRVRELFERVIADGKRVALASSAKEEELAAYKKIANIEDLVDEETSADDAEKTKPHPDIFEAALERLKDVNPSEAVVVGDTPYDAEAAGKAGLKAVGLLCGGFPEADLRAAGCVRIYRDAAHLLAEYDSSPLAARE
jgi:HAD superfamily hydrolase (TIGR01549 family)